MVNKQNLILDYYCFNKMYPGNSKESFFINCADDQHQKLILESEIYSLGIILEKFDYLKKYLGDTKEMFYFKNLK